MSDSDATMAVRTLTAILPAESPAVDALREALRAEGISTFVSHRARGALPGSPLSTKNEPIWQEMIILEAIVPTEAADRIFERAFTESMDSDSGGGFLFMGKPGMGAFSHPSAE